MKQIFYILFFLFSIHLSAQEICNNGIDDDGDTFVDLNDTVDCSCGIGTPPANVSLIPNPSFEQRTCCPTTYGQLNCVSGWSEAVDGSTPDYFNKCNYVASPINTASLNTFPDGSACTGIVLTSDYKEYINSCLSSSMIAGTEYRLKFNVASLKTNPYLNNCPSGFINNFGPVDLTVYGRSNCAISAAVTGTVYNCPSSMDPGWVVLGSVTYTPSANWSMTTITFTPVVNVSAIALGGPCSLPLGYPSFGISSSYCIPYFLIDNLTLNTSDKVGLIDVTSTGHYCTNNLVLKANIVTSISSGASLQWYHNGVALVGQTSTTYSVPTGISGIGNYQLQVSSGGSCVMSPIHSVVSTPPTISVYNPTICATAGYTLSLLATCPVINTFSWSTGATGNTISVSPSGTTVYTVSGIYGSCISQATPTVTVIWGLSDPLSISATTLNVCPGATVGLTAVNPGYVNNWNDGGWGYLISATNGTNAVIKPFSTLTYTFNSVYNNPVGSNCQGKAMITISVTPSSVSITPNNIKICPGRSITLTAMGANSYTWSNGTNSNTTVVTPTVNTTYTVIGNDGVCTVTATASIRADSTINVSIAYDDYSCAASTNTLYAYGANSYTWSSGSIGNQVIVSPTVATTYSVVGSKGYCTAQASATVNVIDPSLFSVSANTLICLGQNSTFSIAPVPSPFVVPYKSLEGTTLSSTIYFYSSAYTITPTITSTYTVTTYIQNVLCIPVSVITVSVIPQPTLNVLPANVSICNGDNVNLIASGASDFVWSNGSISNSITVSPAFNTTYTVSGSEGTCTSSITSSVFVNQLPVVSLEPIPVLCINDTPFILNGNPTNGIFSGTGVVANSLFDPANSGAGSFSVIYDYTDTNGCSNFATQTATVNYCTGIVEFEKSIDISVSPNPTNSALSITSSVDYSSVKITNSIGQTVLTQENKYETISVLDLSNGVYFIQLLDKKGNLLKTKKFIKE